MGQLSRWLLLQRFLGGARAGPCPEALTKCWSLRRWTTRDVQSPMGTRSGDVRYRRSRHSAALCFALSMVSLKDRRQRPLNSTPVPAAPGATRGTSATEEPGRGGRNTRSAHASTSCEGSPCAPRPSDGQWAAPKGHLQRRHIEHKRGKGPCGANPTIRLFTLQCSLSTRRLPPLPPTPGSGAFPTPHTSRPPAPSVPRAGPAPRRPLSRWLTGLGSPAPWNPRAPRGWAGATADTLGGLGRGFCSGCEVTKGTEYPQCCLPSLPHPSNFCDRPPGMTAQCRLWEPVSERAGWRSQSSGGSGSAWRERGF